MICDWKESLPAVIALAKNENGDTQWNLLIKLKSQRTFWLFWFTELVKMKRIPKIEELPKEDKLRLWEFVKNEQLNDEEKKNLIRCICAINYLQTL